MRLIFIYGPAAAGKLTVGRELARITGLPLFHNHLVVDAVAAVFPFGSEPFVRLRESLWLQVFQGAVAADRSLIFTFAPEPTVDPSFPARVRELVERAGGEVVFVALRVPVEVQERRLVDASRADFGKLRSVELLRDLRPGFDRCLAAMPPPAVDVDTATMAPQRAAEQIAGWLSA